MSSWVEALKNENKRLQQRARYTERERDAAKQERASSASEVTGDKCVANVLLVCC
jgi:hypothetical protein